VRIAYLAPEIPALSATFVYNEILALEELGNEILPISVHKPKDEAMDSRLSSLKNNVIHLYDISKFSVIKSNLYMSLLHPICYLHTLWLLLTDMFKLGVFSRNALGLGYRFFFSAQLARLLINNNIQHLHVHFAHVPTDIAMYASKMSGVPFSVTAHANDIFERGWLLREKVARSHFFATISDFNKRFLINDKQVDASKLRIIRCGVDTRVFNHHQRPIISSPVNIGVIGRLVEKKGIDTLIDAMKLLSKTSAVNFKLNIAGSGPLEVALKSQVEHSQLNANVIFLGALAHSDVAEFISSLDLFVLPCKKDKNGDMDGIPVVLMEAMMSGVPVISSQISGIPELVINDVTGLLVEPDNVAQLVQAIMKLTENEMLQKSLSDEAKNKVEQEFSLLVNAQRLNALFQTSIRANE
tara:strand:- start:183004 stop:184239 length:1236 start_codon:yes stop_codon:yes gene_type:complete